MAMGKLWGMPVIPFSLRSPSHFLTARSVCDTRFLQDTRSRGD